MEQEELKNLKIKTPQEINEAIKTYADALMFMKSYAKYSGNNEGYLKDMLQLIDGDYDETDCVNVVTDSKTINLLAIRTNDRYYLLDPYSQYMGKSEWLAGYKLNKASFDDGDSLIKALDTALPDENVSGAFFSPKDADGNIMATKSKFGITLFEYCGHDFPFDYGLPELSGKDIAALVEKANNGDYETVKDTIRTIPDLARFLKEYGYSGPARGYGGPNGERDVIETAEYVAADVGNIVYKDDPDFYKDCPFYYTVSAIESLMLKQGQCTTVSGLFNYMLQNDYDEYGYVDLRFFDSQDKHRGYDGHVFAYIKTNGLYYLVNPMDYGDDTPGFMMHYDGKKACSDSLEELMDCVFDSTYPRGLKTATVVAFVFDGIYARKYVFSGDRYDASKNKMIMPTGAELKVCIGCEYGYEDPGHPTTFDHIIGVQLRSMQ